MGAHYRGYVIHSETNALSPFPIAFEHEDFDGTEDANDKRYGYATDYADAINQIDELEDE